GNGAHASNGAMPACWRLDSGLLRRGASSRARSLHPIQTSSSAIASIISSSICILKDKNRVFLPCSMRIWIYWCALQSVLSHEHCRLYPGILSQRPEDRQPESRVGGLAEASPLYIRAMVRGP